MKKSIKNQSKKSKQQTSNSKTLNNDTLEIKRVPLFDFIKNQLGGIELTPEQMKELEPERPVINYSMFPINPDEDYEYDL
ncbi:MAG: hypothetical protein COZ80_07885 [Ignavibacteria bacterium CG_4_8_14_3_um_filter_37_9]|nr:MAG: hypothetical protein COZ80_07885 [Ignavibacteria bacterium CG_4_8_14_3_um_filter_37_9]PIX92811.1 MAG: hypothetical protein COZ25_13900 [Ignavibacteria bacterium CG_4_10_14_3_um_filter_37_18]